MSIIPDGGRARVPGPSPRGAGGLGGGVGCLAGSYHLIGGRLGSESSDIGYAEMIGRAGVMEAKVI